MVEKGGKKGGLKKTETKGRESIFLEKKRSQMLNNGDGSRSPSGGRGNKKSPATRGRRPRSPIVQYGPLRTRGKRGQGLTIKGRK